MGGFYHIMLVISYYITCEFQLFMGLTLKIPDVIQVCENVSGFLAAVRTERVSA